MLKIADCQLFLCVGDKGFTSIVGSKHSFYHKNCGRFLLDCNDTWSSQGYAAWDSRFLSDRQFGSCDSELFQTKVGIGLFQPMRVQYNWNNQTWVSTLNRVFRIFRERRTNLDQTGLEECFPFARSSTKNRVCWVPGPLECNGSQIHSWSQANPQAQRHPHPQPQVPACKWNELRLPCPLNCTLWVGTLHDRFLSIHMESANLLQLLREVNELLCLL